MSWELHDRGGRVESGAGRYATRIPNEQYAAFADVRSLVNNPIFSGISPFIIFTVPQMPNNQAHETCETDTRMCNEKMISEIDHTDLALHFLSGGGEMGARIRLFDWSHTPLGRPENWSASLKTAVSIMLNAAAPAYIAWGSGYIQLYNDAYRPILGKKHPAAIGIGTHETWHEVWNFIEPLFENVMISKQAISFENQLLQMERNGYSEECYFTFSYSPLMDENGRCNGVFVTAWETTAQVINQRRTDHLKHIDEKLYGAETVAEIRAVFEQLGSICEIDLPFALWYDHVAGTSQLERVAVSGMECGTVLSPDQFDPKLHCYYRTLIDPLNSATVLGNIDCSLLRSAELLPSRMWPRSVGLKPVCYSTSSRHDGYVIFGLNPLRLNDDAQLKFITEVARRFEHAMRRFGKSRYAQREADHQLDTVLKAVPCLVWMSDKDNACVFFNQAWLVFRGRLLEQELGGGWANGIHPADLDRVVSEHRTAFNAQANFAIEYRLQRADGDYRWILDQSTPRYNISGDFVGYIGTCLDITEHRSATTALRLSEARNRRIVETAQEGILVVNRHGYTTFANPRLEQLIGLEKGQAIGRSIYDFMDPHTRTSAQKRLKQRIFGHAGHGEYRLRKADGTEWWALVATSQFVDLDEGSVGVLAMVTDITDRKMNEFRIQYLATHDSLTGLPGRTLLNERISQLIGSALQYKFGLGIIFIDLDHFKYINDSYGHSVGDALLKVVAETLQDTINSGDMVARLGGDEFVVLLTNLHYPYSEAAIAANNLLARLALPFIAEGIEFTVSASLGIALCPSDGRTPDELLMHADTAMYRAKESGRSKIQFYNAEMSHRAMERTSLLAALRHALGMDQFELHYQPQVRMSTRELIGMEALVRWKHPQRGLIPPAIFIPIAEESGLIVPIGEWILRTACAQNRAWQLAGLPHVTISVNLSALQLRQPGFLEMVEAVLDETELDPCYLDLELTESMVMEKNGATRDLMQSLTELGIGLSIDDFGTGYSNLGYLSSFKVTTLKIDQSFVLGVPADKDAASIVSAINNLGMSLGLRIIAEGVETEAHAEFLASVGCEFAQGYLYSKPLPSNQFAAWIQGTFNMAH